MRSSAILGSASCVVTLGLLGACNALNGSEVTFSNSVADGGSLPGLIDGSTSADGAVGRDGSTLDGSSTTDGSTLPTCDPSKAFGTPTLVTSVSEPADEDEGARLSPDELTMYLSSDRASAAPTLYVATRATPSAPFGTPTRLLDPSVTLEARFPSVSGNGLFLYAKVTSGFGGAGLGDVFFATRATPSGAFGTLTPLPMVNGASDDGNPFVREDGAALYFGSTRSGGTDIYRAEIAKGNQVSAPQLVAELASGANDTSATVTPDELTIYFGSTRGGGGQQAMRDIYVARRASPSMPFGAPVVVPEVSAANADDVPTWISRDGCRLYLASNRGGTYDIFLATRP